MGLGMWRGGAVDGEAGVVVDAVVVEVVVVAMGLADKVPSFSLIISTSSLRGAEGREGRGEERAGGGANAVVVSPSRKRSPDFFTMVAIGGSGEGQRLRKKARQLGGRLLLRNDAPTRPTTGWS